MTHSKKLTMAELLIVSLILVTLGAVAAPRISRSAGLDRQAICNSNLERINLAIETHYNTTGQYPNSIEDIVSDQRYFPSGCPQCPMRGHYILNAERHAVCTH